MLDNPQGGLGYAAEFQSSALPWCTASVTASVTASHFSFPKITRFIGLINHGTVGTYIRLGFTQNGVNSNNSIRVNGGSETQVLEFRVTDVYVRAEGGTPTFTLYAGLANIASRMMPVLTGTLPNGSGGWGGVG
jgi:hypothetical protein